MKRGMTLAALTMALPGLAFGEPAEPAAATVTVPGVPGAGQFVELSLALLAVIVVIVISAFLMRRLGRFTGAGGGALRVIGGVSLGSRERAVLIEVGGEQLLVGVSPGSVRMLHVLDRAVEPAPQTAMSVPFADRLQALLRGAGKRDPQGRDGQGGGA